jgi:N-acetylneuraminic acid mutarotase
MLGRALATLLVLVGTAVLSGAQSGVWIRRADLPTPRTGLSTCVVDGKIYAMGGVKPTHTSLYFTVEMYDPATDTWTPKADMPTARSEMATCAIDGRIYAAAGIQQTGSGITYTPHSLEVYDPATDTWTKKADMPSNGGGICTAEAVDGKMLVFSAWGKPAALGLGPSYASVDVYDPATDTWSHEAELPTDTADIVASLVDGKVYTFFSETPALTPRGLLQVYDPIAGTWTRRADMPRPRYDFDASVVDGKIYAIGGYRSEYGYPVYPTVEVYDPATDSWTRGIDMPEPRGELSTSVVDGRIYAIGGVLQPNRDYISAFPAPSAVYMYDPGRPELIDRATLEYSVLANQATPVSLEVALKGPSADGTFPPLQLDLSPLGVTEPVPFSHQGQGRYVAEPVLNPATNGRFQLPVWLAVPGADPEVLYGLMLTVVPPADLALFADGSAAGWQWRTSGQVALDSAAAVVFQGAKALAVQAKTGFWEISCRTAAPVNRYGYTALRLALHPGDATGKLLSVKANANPDWNLLARIDLTNKARQVVDIPLDSLLQADEPLIKVAFSGNLKGSFYLDEVEFVAATPPPPVTAVLEEYTASLPRAFDLAQNYPNPFNSETVITFELPQSGEVELAVFNLAGQQVALLAQGRRDAGAYVLRWDGRDEDGHDLASGVYLYELRAGERRESRKLVLLR